MEKNEVEQPGFPKEILIDTATKQNLTALQNQMDITKKQIVALSNMAIGMVLKSNGIDNIKDNAYQINRDCSKFILIKKK